MAVIETWFNQDLQKPVKVHYLDGSMFSDNGNGNRIGVNVYDNGEPVALTGTVSGYAVLSDGSTVPCSGGLTGNKASILVPPSAYFPGSLFLTVFLTDGTTVTTLAAVSTSVLIAKTPVTIDPGSAVIDDWTQTINGAMQSVQTAAANLGQIVATPYPSLTYPVPLGKYTYYNGNLYRCVSPIASSEEFTPAHWSSAINLGDEVSDLKSAIASQYSNVSTYEVGDYVWYNGYIYKCKKAVTTAESFDVNKWVAVTESSELKTAYKLFSCIVPTSDSELNRIIKRLYIPSTVSVDLSVVNRVTIYNGAANLYGFRFFNSSNVKQLDFTKSTTFTGLTKIGNVIADIGDLSAVNGTSKNYYCTVYDSVLYLTELETDYQAFESDVKHRIAPEFSSSVAYNAGEYVWYNNVLQKFVSPHSAGSYDSSEMSAVNNGIAYDLYSIAVMFALPYDATQTYSVGDYCTLQNKYLYRCKTAITTAEPFTVSHWERIFLTNVIKEIHEIIEGIAVSSNPTVNRLIKRLYIPASANVDITTITRATFYNGFIASAGASPMYGYRLFAGNTKVVDFVVTNNAISGYETNSEGCYTEIGDLSLIGGTSATYNCFIYPTVLEENGIINDYYSSKNAKNNESFGTYIPVVQESQGQNTGDQITVMSYNVAKYNNDVSSVIIPNEKIHNIINEISKINADIICIQEDTNYIDSNEVRTANDYLYFPQYPGYSGLFQTTVRSKRFSDGYNTLTYSNGRWLGYAVFTIGAKKILVVSTHPVAGTDASSISARETQYTELFQWINGDINLSEIDIPTQTVGDAVHVPEHTHVIIGMDANCLTDDDKETLTDLASDNNYKMCNGGRIGWVKTGRNRFEWFSVDNIIVSDNIIINSFEAMTEKYSDLYSDHVPLVAKLTLTDN